MGVFLSRSAADAKGKTSLNGKCLTQGVFDPVGFIAAGIFRARASSDATPPDAHLKIGAPSLKIPLS